MNSEGGSAMVCSKEIEERAIKATKEAADAFYLPQIEKQKEEIAYLKAQLALYENN